VYVTVQVAVKVVVPDSGWAAQLVVAGLPTPSSKATLPVMVPADDELTVAV
jgi:hypothetical protein